MNEIHDWLLIENLKLKRLQGIEKRLADKLKIDQIELDELVTGDDELRVVVAKLAINVLLYYLGQPQLPVIELDGFADFGVYLRQHGKGE